MKQFWESLDFSGVRQMLPTVIMSAFVAAILVLGVLRLSGTGGGGSVSVAVFDVVKFANAQRALASQFVGKRDDPTEAGTLLLSLSKKTTAVIEKVAGPGTLVLVKQGVVSGSQIDITDEVLRELGLPTDVPTADPVKYVSEVAPTMLMMPARPTATAAPQSATQDENSKVVP